MNVNNIKKLAPIYFQNAQILMENEQDIINELKNWLPKKIIDFHTHIGLVSSIGSVPDYILETSKSTFLSASATMHKKINEMIYPGVEITQVAFALPFQGISITNVNKYIALLSKSDKSFIAFCTGRSSRMEEFWNDWNKYSSQFKGLKFYPECDGRKQSILDVFPSEILSLSNDLKIPIIMHLPDKLTHSVDEFLNIALKYPLAPMILAHMGREKIYSKKFMDALKKLSKVSNVYFDTSMVFDKEMFRATLEILGSDKLLYATDQPINLLRVKPVIHPKLGLRYIIDYPYHWVNNEEQAYYRSQGLNTDLKLAVLATLIALRSTIEESFKDSSEIKDKIFYSNAKKLLAI